ncbi:MAG: UDP-N-acetylglucosamine 2-epimerase (hydrolyzing) [Candidatus Marinimicrobia bacterium]|nr:UDP-N-acetylglucosamine 2-epimerase (hydrolyzing) [Candidatus Neomarinimicrobiota bacterium]
MKTRKKIVFLTGTRADFGKLKSLIDITENSELFDVYIFVTGMHLIRKFGYTVDEIEKCGYKNIYTFKNHDFSNSSKSMDISLANTIKGFNSFISKINPDLIIVHGDRVEALAGAISGSLNNKLVAHIEGGEISGTIDELIRHAVTKMSHIHFVSNKQAADRLTQLGEINNSIYVIGSPDLDLMNPTHLPDIDFVKNYYDISFDNYALAAYHPVTTELEHIPKNAEIFVNSLIESKKNYVLIYPNNDLGNELIIKEYKRLKNNKKFRIFPSLRFEYFLSLLKNADFIIGNSSAGIREAPYYNLPTIDIGTRQLNRFRGKTILHCHHEERMLLEAIDEIKDMNIQEIAKDKETHFGDGNSNKVFLSILKEDNVWGISPQKQFQDI